MRIWGKDNKDHPQERIIAIGKTLHKLYPDGEFRYLDLCCGEGDVIISLSNWFSKAKLYGIDMQEYKEWKTKDNLKFKQVYLQDFIENAEDTFEVCSLLNTHRNWPEEFIELKKELYKWLQGHVKYFITSIGNTRKDSKLPFKYKIIGIDTREYPLVLCNVAGGEI